MCCGLQLDPISGGIGAGGVGWVGVGASTPRYFSPWEGRSGQLQDHPGLGIKQSLKRKGASFHSM